jgi:hypothetical protein
MNNNNINNTYRFTEINALRTPNLNRVRFEARRIRNVYFIPVNNNNMTIQYQNPGNDTIITVNITKRNNGNVGTTILYELSPVVPNGTYVYERRGEVVNFIEVNGVIVCLVVDNDDVITVANVIQIDDIVDPNNENWLSNQGNNEPNQGNNGPGPANLGQGQPIQVTGGNKKRKTSIKKPKKRTTKKTNKKLPAKKRAIKKTAKKSPLKKH